MPPDLARATPRLVAIVLLAVAWPNDARAYCRATTCLDCKETTTGCISEGVPLFWPTSCLTYDVQARASQWSSYAEVDAAAHSAFTAWTTSTCADGNHPSIRLEDRGPVNCGQREFNDGSNSNGGNANIVLFRSQGWLDNPDDGTTTLALTTSTFDTRTGEIFDADIEINENKRSTVSAQVADDAYDLVSILTHETGHFLGLAHSTLGCSGPNHCPTMTPIYETGSTDYRTLEPDDVAGICAIYPSTRAPSDESCEPHFGFSAECGEPIPGKGCCATAPGRPSGAQGSALVALALGTVAFAHRRRRTS